MEHLDNNESSKNLLLRFVRVAKNMGVMLVEELKMFDLNPDEGKLRASGAPSEAIQQRIPDYPPIHDDTLPKN